MDKGRSGWKWSLAADANGIPLGWAATGANRNDLKLMAPTLEDVAARGFLPDIETLHLDRGYDYPSTPRVCAGFGITDTQITARRPTRPANTGRRHHILVPLGLRWVIERTNSWLVNFGQLRRNTDRRSTHRRAQLALAITLLLTAKLIDWRDRWSPIR